MDSLKSEEAGMNANMKEKIALEQKRFNREKELQQAKEKREKEQARRDAERHTADMKANTDRLFFAWITSSISKARAVARIWKRWGS